MELMMVGVRDIAVTNDYRTMFGEDNPELTTFNELQDTCSESSRALIAIAPREGSAFTRDSLAAIKEMTDSGWQAPYSSRVDSLTNPSHSQALEDDLTVEPLVEGAESLSDTELADIETVARTVARLPTAHAAQRPGRPHDDLARAGLPVSGYGRWAGRPPADRSTRTSIAQDVRVRSSW